MSYKCVMLLIVVCIAIAAAMPNPQDDGSKHGKILSRKLRSPEEPKKGSVKIDYNQDRGGKRGSVEYNHNLHTSKDGNFRVDAYGQASRDFTHNRNDYGGGVRGSWRF